MSRAGWRERDALEGRETGAGRSPVVAGNKPRRELVRRRHGLGRLLRPNGEGKVLEFLDEEEIGLNRWKLTRALRGQFGTERAASLLKNIETPFIWLDGAFVAAGLQASEVGFELNWRVGTIIN